MKLKVCFLLAFIAGFCCLSAEAQTKTGSGRNNSTKESQSNRRTVRGVVTDNSGDPLPGAAVMIKGTKKGVVTNLDGKYSIEVADSRPVLVFSFLGMNPVEIRLDATQTVADATMVSDETLEGAVINAGYGFIQNKENLTGAAFEVKGEDLRIKPANRLDDLLVGQVAGLNVIEDNSNGRTSIKVRIRGDGSLSASSEPLWVIDGNPVYTGTRTNSVTGTSYTVSPLSFLNMDDIESMTVLKDATTTALYGADGANGVILVTTKSAHLGKTSYNASLRYGLSDVDRSTTVKWAGTQDWWNLAKLAWTNRGYKLENFPYQDNEYNSYSTTDTDWFKEYMGVGQTKELNFSASNGGKKLDNFFSLSYFDSTSPVKGNYQNRFSARNKTTLKFTDKFTAEFNLSGTYNHNDIFSISNSYLEQLPIFAPYDKDGNYVEYNYYSTTTDHYEIRPKRFVYCTVSQRNENDNYQNTLSAEASGILRWKPFKGLELTSQNNINLAHLQSSVGDFQFSQRFCLVCT